MKRFLCALLLLVFSGLLSGCLGPAVPTEPSSVPSVPPSETTAESTVPSLSADPQAPSTHTCQFGPWQATRKPTCSESGSESRFCLTDPTHQESRSIPALGHSAEVLAGAEPTCTDSGMTQGSRCSVCGEILVPRQEIPATGHWYETWEVQQIPTLSACGTETSACIRCGQATSREVSYGVYLSQSSTRYGYSSLASTDNGSAKQQLYRLLLQAAEDFQDSGADADGNLVREVDYVSLGLTVDEALAVLNVFRQDNPLFYWISGTVQYTSRELYLETDPAYASGVARTAENLRLYTQISVYLDLLSQETEAYMVALACHDAIILATDYALDSGGQPETAHWAHSIAGVLHRNQGVCDGYAKTFQLLLNLCGIDCITVSGDSTSGRHAWNLVCLDGAWYWCDLTWDDTPRQQTGVSHNYFCVTDDAITDWRDGQTPTAGSCCFLDNHSPDSCENIGIGYQPPLPQRSQQPVANALLRSTFWADGCLYAILRYDAVQLLRCETTGDVTVPETVSSDGRSYTVAAIGPACFLSGVAVDQQADSEVFPYARSVTLPASIRYLWNDSLNGLSLESIAVDQGNPSYTAVDGVLFTKGMETLIRYPSARRADAYSVPAETRNIAYNAFTNCPLLTQLYLGANVSGIGQYSFGTDYTRDPGPVLNGFARSMALHLSHCAITIDSENPWLLLDNGLLLSGDGCTLYACQNQAQFTVPTTVTGIHKDAFAYCPDGTTILFPGTAAQWRALLLNTPEWNRGSGEINVVCTDTTVVYASQID